jgi:hypothetical protein
MWDTTALPLKPLDARTPSDGKTGAPRSPKRTPGFPVELAGAGELHAAFLNESRTRSRGWRPVQEIRIRGPKMMGAAQRSLSLHHSKIHITRPTSLNKALEDFGTGKLAAPPLT